MAAKMYLLGASGYRRRKPKAVPTYAVLGRKQATPGVAASECEGADTTLITEEAGKPPACSLKPSVSLQCCSSKRNAFYQTGWAFLTALR